LARRGCDHFISSPSLLMEFVYNIMLLLNTKQLMSHSHDRTSEIPNVSPLSVPPQGTKVACHSSVVHRAYTCVIFVSVFRHIGDCGHVLSSVGTVIFNRLRQENSKPCVNQTRIYILFSIIYSFYVLQVHFHPNTKSYNKKTHQVQVLYLLLNNS